MLIGSRFGLRVGGVAMQRTLMSPPTLPGPAMNPHFETTRQILLQVLDGQTYASVGGMHGLGKTAVEKRVKTLVERLISTVGIQGMNRESVLTADRLRNCRAAIVAALERFDQSQDRKSVV